MYHTYGGEEKPWQHGVDATRGVTQLKRLGSDRVLWDLPRKEVVSTWQAPRLLDFARANSLTVLGNEIARSLGWSRPIVPGLYPIEYGSSSAVAWIREDLVMMNALTQMPGSVGLLTLAKGGVSLRESLLQTVGSWGVLGGNVGGAITGLFTRDELYSPACWASLPRWSEFWRLLESSGFSAVKEVVQKCYMAVEGGSWFDFVGLYRHVTGQYLSKVLGLSVEMTTMAGEDVALTSQAIAKMSINELARMVGDAARIGSWQQSPRVLNFPCQAKSRCDHWHYLNTRGRQVGYKPGAGADVPKPCRIRSPQLVSVRDAITLGAGLSGMGIYFVAGMLGQEGEHLVVARDYSKGQIYRVLSRFFEDNSNRLRVLPYGATYIFGKGCDPKVSIDGLVLLEILLRSKNPKRILTQVFEALPIPYAEAEETHIEIGLDGTVNITRKEV